VCEVKSKLKGQKSSCFRSFPRLQLLYPENGGGGQPSDGRHGGACKSTRVGEVIKRQKGQTTGSKKKHMLTSLDPWTSGGEETEEELATKSRHRRVVAQKSEGQRSRVAYP